MWSLAIIYLIVVNINAALSTHFGCVVVQNDGPPKAKFLIFKCKEENTHCCPEGCCYNTFEYPSLWIVIVAAILVFFSVFICVCACYHLKRHCFDGRVHPQANQNGERRLQRAAAPPSYDIAILMPQVHQNGRVPSYEEVMAERETTRDGRNFVQPTIYFSN